MSISLNDTKWGTYKTFEGPYHPGKIKYTLVSAAPSLSEKLIYIISQTEGGSFDAVNMYDTCISSVGLLQFCDKYLLVQRLLGEVADVCGLDVVTTPLQLALNSVGATFKKNKNAQWRFFIGTEECNNVKMLQKLYLGGSSGTIGDWTPQQKRIAQLWTMGLTNIWDNEKACAVQVDYTAKRLMSFVLPPAKAILFTDDNWDEWVGVVKATYLSFAANNPKIASQQLEIAVKNSKHEKWLREWCLDVIKQLTFGPEITIYPGRYDHLRHALERIFNVELPKSHIELEAWVAAVVEAPAATSSNVEDDTESRLVDPTASQTLPSLEAPLTSISAPPDNVWVTAEEAEKPFPLPPLVPAELRKTTPITGTTFIQTLMYVVKMILQFVNKR